MTPPQVALYGRLPDFWDKKPAKDLYRSPEQVARLHVVHKIDSFNVKEPSCFDIYNSCLRTDGLCMTITPPEHNVIRIVEPPKRGKERVRKLSIDEHFRLMGFTMNEDFREIQFPPTQNYTRLGGRAGNGWDVNLTGLQMRHIFEQLPELPDPEV